MTQETAGRNTPAQGPSQGESELIRNLLEEIMGFVEDSLAEARIHSATVPMDRLKTLSKLIAYKANSVTSECSALDTCIKHDAAKREGQLDEYREALRSVMFLALEAELNVNRLESAFNARRGC